MPGLALQIQRHEFGCEKSDDGIVVGGEGPLGLLRKEFQTGKNPVMLTQEAKLSFKTSDKKGHAGRQAGTKSH